MLDAAGPVVAVVFPQQEVVGVVSAAVAHAASSGSGLLIAWCAGDGLIHYGEVDPLAPAVSRYSFIEHVRSNIEAEAWARLRPILRYSLLPEVELAVLAGETRAALRELVKRRRPCRVVMGQESRGRPWLHRLLGVITGRTAPGLADVLARDGGCEVVVLDQGLSQASSCQ